MKRILLFFIVMLSITTVATPGLCDVYKFVDAGGVLHFSPDPKPGYELYIKEKSFRSDKVAPQQKKVSPRQKKEIPSVPTKEEYEKEKKKHDEYWKDRLKSKGFVPSDRGDGTYIQLFYKPTFPTYNEWSKERSKQRSGLLESDGDDMRTYK